MTGRLRGAGMTVALASLMAVFAVVNQPAEPAPLRPDDMVPVAEERPIRQTEAEALAEAAATGHRVEIGAFRGESREVYANPDGTTTAVEHAQPVRVVRDGRWVTVDATLERRPDGSLTPKAATLGLRLSGGGNAPLVQVERGGRQMTLDWPGALPPPTVEGDRATYAEVLPGVDLVVNVSVTGFSHVLVVKTPQAAQHPELATLDFELSASGLAVRKTATGGLAAVDTASGGTVLEAAAPMMWDSGPPNATASRAADPDPTAAVTESPPAARTAPIQVALREGGLSLTPDRAMLTDPGTRWPVYIDPVWQDTRNSGWVMVSSGHSTARKWQFGDEGVGECPVSSGTCNGTGIKRLFYALPTPYSGRSILSAQFKVTMVHTYNGSAKGVSLYRAGGGISSATNWENKPALSELQQTISPTGTQSSCTATNQNVEFNATAAVREAASRKWATTTFGMRAVDEGDFTAWKRFCGNAILSVHYNRAPATPKQSELGLSPGGSCIYGETRPYVDVPPRLTAILRDPDHAAPHTEKLTGEFKIYWNTASGATVTRTYQTGQKASGSIFSMVVPADVPKDAVLAWEVRASDGETWGPWSSDGAQTRCEFVIDSDVPTAPNIVSMEYLPAKGTWPWSECNPEDEQSASLGGIGIYGTFVFDSDSTDVVEYRYGFGSNASPNNVLRPSADGGPVTLRWMPETDGPIQLNVVAVDRAARTTQAMCWIQVATRSPVAQWGLSDSAGSSSAADTGGHHPAVAGAGVTFGAPGPSRNSRTAATLTGATDSYLATTNVGLVDTRKGFSASAWVRLTDDTQDRTVVSQDGTGEPGFTLGFDGASKKWTFDIPAMDVESLGTWVVSGGPVVKGVWTHLTAAYDAETRAMRLYVNGVLQPPAQRSSEWRSRGAVQIGRRVAKSGYTDRWAGDLTDVILFDRVVVAREVKELSTLAPIRRAYWPLNEVSGDQSPEYDGGTDLTLAGGAQIYAPDLETDPLAVPALVGQGHMQLDGVDDHATSGAPSVKTDESFTVTARVRLAALPNGRAMTVLAQGGAHRSAFVMRCNTAGQWEVALTTADEPTATATLFPSGIPVNADQAGQHLALVYNAFNNEVKFYVDGQLTGAAAGTYLTWNAPGALQVGRVFREGIFGDYFPGVIDDVRVYSGVADETFVQRLAQPTEQPEL
ncbi:LamG-like jellyroll fold domain-containing protein [Actinomycetes bacterium KLBMP 9797]